MRAIWWRAGFAAFLVPMLGQAASIEGRAMQPGDLHHEIDITEPRLSPDGQWGLFTASHDNVERDAAQTQIWLVRWDGSAKRQFTAGAESSASHGVWTPDGKAVVYLSDEGDSGNQVWIRPIAGGAARQVTHLPEAVDDFVLSPDGKSLALISEDPKPEVPKGHPEPPFVTERFQFMDDDVGFLNDRRRHLYIADLAKGKPVLLTPGPHDEWLPSWSPDGKTIAFVTKRGADADRHINFDIYTVEAKAGGAERQITNFPGSDSDPYWNSRPDWSPDGTRIAYLRGGEEKWLAYAPWQLTITDLSSGRTWQPAPIDRNFWGPRWSGDGKSIYARIEEPEDTHLARIDAGTGAITLLTEGKRLDDDFDVGKGDRIVVLGGDWSAPYEIAALDPGLRPISHMNDDWLKGVARQDYEDLRFKAADGTEIHGLLVRPKGYQPGRRYPTILRLHGGPEYQFSHEFMLDWQVYAARGYAVVAVNPRGSTGRGFDFAKAIYADWGNVDGGDALAAVDAVVGMGVADPDRLGLGGWSYGGILTDVLIARDKRFKAAISGAGTGNMIGNYGLDEYASEYEIELGTPWENFDAYARVSAPFLHADRISTPTLFLCAGDDMNVPCNGSEQMYQALRSRNVPTRLIRFPGQHHEPTIPSYLEFRLKSYLEWYDRFLKP
jgi:dipeptidyl aminopeptidase/acylaminoacyl peptidase